MKIANTNIGEKYKPFIIAEMSGNHSGSLNKALKIVKAAKEAGADAIKIQTFLPEDITLNVGGKGFYIRDKFSPWNGKKLFDLYKLAHTPLEWHSKIFNYAKKLGIICFSSVFNEKRIAFLEKLKVPAYKIASFENNHWPLIAAAAKTGKPLIISTGMITQVELDKTVQKAKNLDAKN